jgi:ribosomal protein S18 acetylase RimI-like enzyme
MSFIVRAAQPADAERIASLHVITWQEAYAHLLPGGFFDEEHARKRLEMWNRILGDQRDEWSIAIAESGPEPVGFAMTGPSLGAEGEDIPRGRQLYNIYVVEAMYGTGVGQALLDEVLGDEPAMLWVAKQNPRAIAFYERNGFKLDGVEKPDPGASKITDVRMVR